ncbi:MAG: response regulator [Nitrososphaera sp.]
MTSAHAVDAKLMVVDDEKDIVDLVAKHLKKNGFDAIGFTDPLAALEDYKAHASKYALVITDIRMPGMNGFELAATMQKINPSVKVIIMTAIEVLMHEARVHLPVIIYDDIIRKPAKLPQICSRVRQALQC